MKTDKDLKELLRQAFIVAEDLRCELNNQPTYIAMADKVLILVHMASHQAHDQSCCKRRAGPSSNLMNTRVQ